MSLENVAKNDGEQDGEKTGAVGAELARRRRRRERALTAVEGVAGRLGQLTGAQQQAIALILAGWALAAVARQLKVSRGTLYNWLHGETFRKAMNCWRHDMARAAGRW